MPQRNVASNFTFEQQRVEINNLAQDFWTHKGTVDTAASTYLKHDGSNDFTGQTLAVPNAFTINSNSGNGTVTISGNLDVTGTTTTVSSANLEVTDKNILIAKGSTSDAQADGAGITIDSATDITLNFVDANDAWVSSIGLEATTFLKGPYGQFTGSGTPSTGQGIEINAPDSTTGQIISYDRGNDEYEELRVKGSSVGVYAGTTNALVGSFSSTGLDVKGDLVVGEPTSNSLSHVLLVQAPADANAIAIIGRTDGIGELSFYANDASTKQGEVQYRDTELNIRHRKQGADINFATTPTGGTMGNRFIIASDGNISNECNHTGNAAIFANTNTTAGFGVKIKGGGTTADRYSLAVFNAAGEEKFRVNANGRVGIGNAQPTRLLHVEDTDTSNGNDVATFINDDTTNGYGVNITAGGTASGRYALRVADGASTELFKVKSDSTQMGFAELRGGADVRLTLGNAGTAGTNDSNWIRGVNNNLFYNAATSDHLWEIGGAEHMRLNNSGNLYLRSESANYVVLGNSGDATSNNITNNMNCVRGNGSNVQYNTSGGFHAWEVSGAEKMQLTSDGYLTNVTQAGFTARMTSNFTHPGTNSFNSGTNWVMPFDQEVWDVGSNFNDNNYTYTVPATGR